MIEIRAGWLALPVVGMLLSGCVNSTEVLTPNEIGVLSSYGHDQSNNMFTYAPNTYAPDDGLSFARPSSSWRPVYDHDPVVYPGQGVRCSPVTPVCTRWRGKAIGFVPDLSETKVYVSEKTRLHLRRDFPKPVIQKRVIHKRTLQHRHFRKPVVHKHIIHKRAQRHRELTKPVIQERIIRKRALGHREFGKRAVQKRIIHKRGLQNRHFSKPTLQKRAIHKRALRHHKLGKPAVKKRMWKLEKRRHPSPKRQIHQRKAHKSAKSRRHRRSATVSR